MRKFLILLVLIYPAVLVLPSFWTVVSIWFGAHPMTYIEADGRVQPAVLGPKAKWPEWALVPEEASLKVSAWFAASPPQPETGFGEFEAVRGDPRAVTAAYLGRLRAAGWTVEATENQTIEPSMPPRAYLECVIRAIRSDGETPTIQARIALEAATRPGGIHWWASPPPHSRQQPEGPPC